MTVKSSEIAASFSKYHNSAKIKVFKKTSLVDRVINNAEVDSGCDLMDAETVTHLRGVCACRLQVKL